MASVNQIPERNLDVGHGAQNSLLAYAHRILTAATPFCSLLPPLAALANVPLSTREPWGRGMRIAASALGLLAMTMDFCHSEASAHTGRGNPSFLRWTGVRAAEVVGPYGRSTKIPATGRCGHRPLRDERKSAATAQAALSEAESAEREAGQIRSLPDVLRVQHGAEGPEVSARPRPCSRRSCVH